MDEEQQAGRVTSWIVRNRFLAPFRILLARHRRLRRHIVLYPLILTVATILVIWWLDLGIVLSGETGLVSQVSKFGGLLVGFVVAALSAITAFPKGRIDESMPGTPTVLIPSIVQDGVYYSSVTRRQFLGFLLGYLCAICFLSFFFGILYSSLRLDVLSAFSDTCLFEVLYWMTQFVSLILLWSFFFLISIALYYLSDRLQQDVFKDVG